MAAGRALKAEVVAAARMRLGVRFRHQGRSAEGLDCGGLVVAVARDLGLTEFDVAGYPRRPDGESLLAACRQGMTEIDPSTVEPGDVLCLRDGGAPSHLAIVGDYFAGGLSIIHAYAPARKVIETRLDQAWRARVAGAFRLPGVH